MRFSNIFVLLCYAMVQSAFCQPPEAPKERNPWSAGVFLISDSQPYVDAGRSVRVFPSLSYNGERFRWNGPILQYNLIKEKKWSFSLHSLVQFAPYLEENSPVLAGLGDRSDTLLAGLDWTCQPYPGLLILASVDGEILGAYDGLQATLGLQHSIGKPWERFSGSLGGGLLLQDENWTRYFVGVPGEKSGPERPAHIPGESFHPYLSAQILVRFNSRWSWFALSRIEFLDETWRDSPLISDDYRLVTYTAVNFSF